MKRLAPVAPSRAALLLVTLSLATPALSQSFPRWEFYGGYTLGRFENSTESVTFVAPDGSSTTYSDLCSSEMAPVLGATFQAFFCDRRSFHGFDASVTRNFSRHLGIQADISGHFKDDSFVDLFGPATVRVDTQEKLWSFLGGVQWKDNGDTARFKPFVHFLAGVARYTAGQQQDIDLAPEFNFDVEDRETCFALKLGGGLDVRAGKRIDIRVIGVDYAPVFTGDRDYETFSGPFAFSSTGKTASNFSLGWGIAIH